MSLIPFTDDEKNNDTLNIDDNFLFVINEDNYEKLFRKNKYIKSKKLVHYLMDKVVLFGSHYQDPKRLKLMYQLTTMKKPYKKVFGEDFV
jgi:hypothetical protein